MNFASTKSPSDDRQSFEHSPDDRMLYVPGGTYRMGSDRHYPEEAPVHRVRVDRFWMDRTPVTNRQFRKFVNATGYATFAELTPEAKDYPDALPHMLKAGSLVFTPPKQAVDLRYWGEWWTFKFGANWRRPYGPRSNISGLDDHPVVHVAYRDAEALRPRYAACRSCPSAPGPGRPSDQASCSVLGDKNPHLPRRKKCRFHFR